LFDWYISIHLCLIFLFLFAFQTALGYLSPLWTLCKASGHLKFKIAFC
jgi:hypothetical protein